MNSCARICPTPSPVRGPASKSILFSGTNKGYQLYVSDSGPESNSIPYVAIGNSSIVAFSASIRDAKLQPGQYIYDVCKNAISNATVQQNVLATITLTVTAEISGTLVFTSKPTDALPFPAYVSPPNVNYQLAPATTTWTSSPGMSIARSDAISLFLALSGTPNQPAAAQYEVFISTKI
jgi:hypothetical protein